VTKMLRRLLSRGWFGCGLRQIIEGILVRTMNSALAVVLASLLGIGSAFAASSHYVRGYTTRSGTYVLPHRQTNPNGSKFDNWSTKGNINPYTGRRGMRKP
jgi:hypothetical protein